MSRINPIYSDRIRYKLNHNPTGEQLIQEPKGFKDDDNEFVRDKAFRGMFLQMTNNLTFYGDGAVFIEDIYLEFGINAELILTKEERNPVTDEWELAYSGYLDFFTYQKEDFGISIKFISSGLLRVIKARQNEKIEIDRLDTLKGQEVAYLEPKTVLLEGRNIFLNTKFTTDSKDSVSTAFGMANFKDGNLRTGSLAVPLTKVYASDIKAQGVSKDLSFTTFPDQGTAQTMFYADNDRDKDLKLSIKTSFTTVERKIEDINNSTLRLFLVVFSDSTEYVLKERIPLSVNIINNNSVIVPDISVDYQSTVRLLKGESLSLQWYASANFGGFLDAGSIEVNFTNIISEVLIDENSSVVPSLSKVHLPFEVANRFLKLFTGKDDLFRSSIFGRKDLGYTEDGEASLLGMSHGFWIRGFSKDDPSEVNEENRYKSLTTSFKDMYESYFSTWNLGAGIELEGFKEVFRIEKLDFFFNKNILIRLGEKVNGVFEYVQVNNVKRSLDKDVFNSGIELGYSKGGDYEEAVGLDEYNTKTSYTTIIDKAETTYEAVSKYRADSYGAEFARRKSYNNFPTEDSKYDNSIWLFDMKRNALDIELSTFRNPLEQRLWQDDFEVAPTGVFSPNTAQNLRLSPFNILLRHGFLLGAGLVKYPLDFIRYGSSVANSGMITKLKGGLEYAENGNIQNNKLEKARTDGETIEFEFNVDYDLLQKVKGKSVILGKEVQNFYGLVSFKNENGEIEEGYLEKLSPNGVGKWTLRKFNT